MAARNLDLLDRLVDDLVHGEKPAPTELDDLAAVIGRLARTVRATPSPQARAAGKRFLELQARAAGWHTGRSSRQN